MKKDIEILKHILSDIDDIVNFTKAMALKDLYQTIL